MSMKIYEVRDILKAQVLHGDARLDDTVLAGGGADLMEDVLAAAAKSSVLLTGLTTEQVLRTAKIAGVGCIVFVRGKRPPDNVLALAQSYDLPVLSTRYSLFVACGRLYMNGLRGLDGSW
jgi:predicted transcriptional regulator